MLCRYTNPSPLTTLEASDYVFVLATTPAVDMFLQVECRLRA